MEYSIRKEKKMYLFHSRPKKDKEILKNYILIDAKWFSIMGSYSKTVQDPFKRKLHYLPACIIRWK